MEDLCIPWTLQSFNWQVRILSEYESVHKPGTYGKIEEIE